MEYRTVFANLPTTIPGFAKRDPVDGYTTIVLNSKMCRKKNTETYLHELKHISKGDFDCKGNVDVIEVITHEMTK